MVSDSTFSGNSAVYSPAGVGKYNAGGGVYNTTGASLKLENTIPRLRLGELPECFCAATS